jgi:protein MpaA
LTVLAVAPAAHGAQRDPTVVRTELLGRSAFGRPISVIEVGDPDERRKVLVVGCIHGDEPEGIRIAQTVARLAPPASTDVWIVPALNPDGVAAHTRQNGHGVDLNRNFPWGWRPLGQRGYRYYSGPRALSEPESRLAFHLILRLRPAVSIWFHQPYRLVDESGGADVGLERRFARSVGLPLVRLPRYPGSVTSWENHTLPGTTAFVVELHSGVLSGAEITRFAAAVRATMR